MFIDIPDGKLFALKAGSDHLQEPVLTLGVR